MDGWNTTTFLLGLGLFSGAMSVAGRVSWKISHEKNIPLNGGFNGDGSHGRKCKINWKTNPSLLSSPHTIGQWSFLVPWIGGYWAYNHRIGYIYTTYVPLIYHLCTTYIPNTWVKNPLSKNVACITRSPVGRWLRWLLSCWWASVIQKWEAPQPTGTGAET